MKHLPLLILACAFGNIQAQSTILWSVNQPDYENTSYLLGTYHQMGNSFVDSLPAIRESLVASDLAVFESIVSTDQIRTLLNSRPDDFTHREYLKKKDVEYIESLNLAVPISKVSPTELIMKLQQTYVERTCNTVKDTDTWNHMDSYLIHLAEENHVETYGYESDSVMLDDINNAPKSTLTWEDASKPIHKIVKNIKGAKRIKQICQSGEDYMNFVFDYQFDVECGNNPLIKDRNEKWLLELEKILPEKDVFIAVGLLHLYGRCGLIVQLRERGYVVEPVELRRPLK